MSFIVILFFFFIYLLFSYNVVLNFTFCPLHFVIGNRSYPVMDLLFSCSTSLPRTQFLSTVFWVKSDLLINKTDTCFKVAQMLNHRFSFCPLFFLFLTPKPMYVTVSTLLRRLSNTRHLCLCFL